MTAFRRLSVATTACLGAVALAASTLGPTAAEAKVAPAASPVTTTSTAVFTAKPIKFGRCKSARMRAAKARCGFLVVPMDYAHPSGRTLKLAVSRIKATASRHQGVLISNPGGPGGAGLGLSAYLKDALPRSVSSTYDLIGFDPRGVGASRPAVTCDPTYAKGPRPPYEPTLGDVPVRSANETAWLRRSEDYANACGEKYGSLLAHLTTVEAVKDIDVLRRALGSKRINYYGFSYGTYLGEIYATMYPKHTRRLIFDGVVDPRDIWYGAQLSQDKAFEVAIDRFWKWMADHFAVYHLGDIDTEVEDQFYAEQAKLAADPDGDFGSSEWNDVFVDAGYYQGAWPDVAAAFAAWVKGDHEPMKALHADDTEGDDNGYAMYVAVQCVDAHWPTDYDQWRSDGFATQRRAPFITWNNVWFNTPCIYWPAPQGTPAKVNGKRTPEVLLFNATLDGATPFAGALEVRRRFPHAVLISEEGSTTHADTLNGNACYDNKVARYLKDGHLPKRKAGNGPDVKCKRSPLPQPAEANSVAGGDVATTSAKSASAAHYAR
ncbi:MAG TPA: alpha/beta hydrolase [Sporichthya sp.]|nr:alpha/beta hydrolase [Sporichthya sp.]